MAEKLLLHCCCAVCSMHIIETLKKDYEVVLFFYNPNIHPENEYIKRLENASKIADFFKIKLIDAGYDKERWFNAVLGHENYAEGEERCKICYKFRMEKTAEFALKNGFDIFATTLTISPHKDSKTINKIGKELEKEYKIKFLDIDFKKNDGFKHTIELSKKLNLYRQNYCGCLFSLRSSIASPKL